MNRHPLHGQLMKLSDLQNQMNRDLEIMSKQEVPNPKTADASVQINDLKTEISWLKNELSSVTLIKDDLEKKVVQ